MRLRFKQPFNLRAVTLRQAQVLKGYFASDETTVIVHKTVGRDRKKDRFLRKDGRA